MAMTTRVCSLAMMTVSLACAGPKPSEPFFQTSDRCLACHNELENSFGTGRFDWV